ncbi:MAG TPA: hypothetical protein VFI29_04215, partial [Hanamia sp.]|nr:hypothetical protein [Hanamia sp.]
MFRTQSFNACVECHEIFFNSVDHQYKLKHPVIFGLLILERDLKEYGTLFLVEKRIGIFAICLPAERDWITEIMNIISPSLL